MSEPKIPLARFDAETVEPSLRCDAWRENMGVLFDSTDVYWMVWRLASAGTVDSGD